MSAFVSNVARVFRAYRTFIVTFIVLLAMQLVWWSAFFPAVMTSDSLSQWSQALSGNFDNASPYLHALTMRMLRVVWDSPGAFIALQIVAFSALAASICSYLRRAGAPLWSVALPVVYFVAAPQFGMYAATLWKDVPYSILALALAFLIYRFGTDEEFRARRSALVMLAVTSALLPLFRFNGLPFLVLPALWFLASRKTGWRRAAVLLTVTVAVFTTFDAVVPRVLDVRPVPMMVEGLTLKTVGAIYALDEPELTPQERAAFDEILPEDGFDAAYSPYSVNALFDAAAAANGVDILSPGIDPDPEAVDRWHDAVMSAALKNPEAYVADRFVQARALLGFEGTVYRYSLENTVAPGSVEVVNEPLWGPIRTTLERYLDFSLGHRPTYIALWATFPWVAAGVVVAVMSAASRRWNTLAFVGFVFVNLATALASVPATDYRYVYFVHMCLPFMFALYLAEVPGGRRRGGRLSPSPQ